MKEYAGKKIGNYYGLQSVIVYGAGMTVGIDRTSHGREWAISHGMTKSFTATADGERFNVYTGTVNSRLGGTFDAAIAIPV